MKTWRRIASLLVLLLALAGPVAAQEGAKPDEPYHTFDPALDDPGVLAELAASASREGTLGELRDWLDSLRVSGTAGRNALLYWGALSLQARIDQDSVASAFARHLAEHPHEADAVIAFVEVLEANAALDEAEWLRRTAAGPGGVTPGEASAAPGAAAESLATRLEEARRSGDLEAVRRAVASAIAAGLPAARAAVLRGDLQLAAGAPDSAIGIYAAAVGTSPRHEALEALERVRLTRSLQGIPVGAEVLADVGRTLVTASAEPRAAMSHLDSLAQLVSGKADSTRIAAALLTGLAADRRGELGDPEGASRALEKAAAKAGSEGAGLLLAAGRWARTAGDEERARQLWREVVERHPTTPHDLEARRLLSELGPAR